MSNAQGEIARAGKAKIDTICLSVSSSRHRIRPFRINEKRQQYLCALFQFLKASFRLDMGEHHEIRHGNGWESSTNRKVMPAAQIRCWWYFILICEQFLADDA